MAVIGQNWPSFVIVFLWIFTTSFCVVRELWSKVPILNQLLFWLYAPNLEPEEIKTPQLYRHAKLRAEKRYDAALGGNVKHSFVSVETDVSLHAVSMGDESKPLILFLHGMPEFWYTWRHLLVEFAKTHHVVAIDQRGYNISSKPREFIRYNLKRLCQDVEIVIDHFAKNKGGKCILVGHDWGGNVAWNVAHSTVDSVSQLVILNMAHPAVFDKVLKRAQMKQLRSSMYIVMAQYPKLMDSIQNNGGEAVGDLISSQMKTSLSTEDRAAFCRAAAQPGAMTSAWNWYRAVLLGAKPKRLRKVIEIPVLFLFGEDDTYFEDEECIVGTDKYVADLTFVKVPNCSHWIQNDQPAEVIKHMRQFLK